MDYKIRTYSKGMKQRLGIARPCSTAPRSSSSTNRPTASIRWAVARSAEILLALRDEGKTIFLNSHLLGEVEQICDRVAILDGRDLVRKGDVDTLTRQHGTFVLGLAPGHEFPAEELAQRGFKAFKSKEGLWDLTVGGEQSIDAVVDLIRNRGLRLRHLLEKRVTLEDIFLATVDHQAAES